MGQGARFFAALVTAFVLYSSTITAQESQAAQGSAGASAQAQAGPWWRAARGPAYQVLVYSYADSDGDGWGDLKGLTAHLDWLNDGNPASTSDLGVSAIWLSPINPAASYHGYDVTDYESVSPRLGTMADFDALVAACHARGIHVILDEVFNHSSINHPWFQAALANPSGPYGRYYRFKQPGQKNGTGGLGQFYTAPLPGGGVAEYFSAFTGGMPDFDAGNTDVVNEFKGILKFWLDHGVDGFRFDAAKHIFDPNEIAPGDPSVALNRAFWNDLRRYARHIKPDVLFIGEVLTESPAEVAAYAPAFDLLFDFPTAKRILALSAGSGQGFASDYVRDAKQYARIAGFTLAPLLSNHDQDRAMGLLLLRAGASATEGWGQQIGDTPALAAAKKLALKRARLDAAIELTLPGLPFIYYGEELGMTGRRYANDDVARRDAFPWTPDRRDPPTTSWAKATRHLEPGENRATPSAEEQSSSPSSLLAAYRNLGRLREALPEISGSTLALPDWPGFDGAGVLAWVLDSGGRRFLVVHDTGDADFAPPSPPGAALKKLWASAPLEEGAALPSGESALYEITK
jgi:glycosidase